MKDSSKDHSSRLPSTWVDGLFDFCCPEELKEAILGDLQESYSEDLKRVDLSSARSNHRWRQLGFVHPSIFLRNHLKRPSVNLALYKSHLTLSFRSLLKGRAYSLVNIGGLAFGLAAFILISIYVRYETSYDSFHPGVDNIYRVNQTNVWNPEGGIMSSTPPPLAAALASDHPEIDAVLRINTPGSRLMRYTDQVGVVQSYYENDVLAADSNFFDFFQLPLIEGHAEGALTGIGKVVISDETSRKYFGERSALGEIIHMGDEGMPLQVTGVTESQPENMHFDFDFLISMRSNPSVKQFDWSWIWTQMVTYAKINDRVNTSDLGNKISNQNLAYVQSTMARLGMDFSEFIEDKGGWNFYLQPVRSIHLDEVNAGNRIGRTNNAGNVSSLQILAFLILIIAVINFVNLSTARSNTRSKEIGVKKSLGVRTASMVRQFLLESVMVSTLSLMLAIPILFLLQQAVLRFVGVAIYPNSLSTMEWLSLCLLIPLVVGIMGGVYPALYMTKLRPVNVLKGASSGRGNFRLRNVLVVIQFAISIALIAGTGIIYQQINYANNKDLGFEENGVIVINNAEELGNQIESFRNELIKLGDVESAAISMDVPGRGMWEDFYSREGSNIRLPISQIKIDDYFFDLMGMNLKHGRSFSIERETDRHSVIINETAAEMLGWTGEEAVGQQLTYPGYPGEIRIIGVADDFHFQSLRRSISPLVFFHLDSDMWGDQRVASIKYSTAKTDDLLRDVEMIWNQMAVNVPFEYSFYDDELKQLYEQEKKLGGLVVIFAGSSLLIAIIGLIGMAAYSAEQRKKEIGIRKVLGATVWQIFSQLNRQYLKLFVIALVLAVPLSWRTLDRWLANFAYRVDLNPALFVLAGLVVIILATVSVGYLSLRAASVNPAHVIKDQ